MLTEAERAELRRTLEAERTRILRNAERGLELSKHRDELDFGRDSIDEATQENSISTELRLRDREKKLLDKVDAALERLDAGTADECEDCGEPIGFKRLTARPVTTLCVNCKERREKEESMSAGVRSGGGYGLAEPTEDLGTPTED